MPKKARIRSSKAAIKTDPNIEPNDHNALEVDPCDLGHSSWVMLPNFGLGSTADLGDITMDVRFAPDNRHQLPESMTG
jgi:hypothetical protein